MTAAPDDFAALSARVDRLETGLAEVRTRAENAETLARLADRDTSDIKASHAAIMRSLEALRHTQVDHGRQLTEHGRQLADHGRQLAEHGRQLAEHGRQLAEIRSDVTDIRAGMATVRDGVATIIGLLQNLPG